MRLPWSLAPLIVDFLRYTRCTNSRFPWSSLSLGIATRTHCVSTSPRPLNSSALVLPLVERKLRSVTTSWNGSSTLVFVRFFVESKREREREKEEIKTESGKRGSLISKSVTRKRRTILLSAWFLFPNLYPLFKIDKNYISNLLRRKKKVSSLILIINWKRNRNHFLRLFFQTYFFSFVQNL